MTTTDKILSVLPGTNVYETKRGLQVGGFSMAPVRAREILRGAGLTVKDVYGATIVQDEN